MSTQPYENEIHNDDILYFVYVLYYDQMSDVIYVMGKCWHMARE